MKSYMNNAARYMIQANDKHNVGQGIVQPVSEHSLAVIAFRITGGGLEETATANAMEMFDKMRRLTWKSVSGRMEVIARVDTRTGTLEVSE